MLHATLPESQWVFLAAAVSLVPLAGVIGLGTEELAERAGPALGGFLNATFGNAAELIIALVALGQGHVELVKASISGSIIGNLLLVLGFSFFFGGLGRRSQTFNRTAATNTSTMLFLAVVALVMPAVFDLTLYGTLERAPAGDRPPQPWHGDRADRSPTPAASSMRSRPSAISSDRVHAGASSPFRHHDRRGDRPARRRHAADHGSGGAAGRHAGTCAEAVRLHRTVRRRRARGDHRQRRRALLGDRRGAARSDDAGG